MMLPGDNFRIARERANLSQGQVAEYAETAQGYISGIENNKRWPSTWDLLKRLAERYGVSTDWLLGNQKAISPEAMEAGELVNSLPEERRAGAVALLRGIIEYATAGNHVATRSGPAWEAGSGSTQHRELGLPVMEEPTKADLERRLALLKKMLPPNVYEYVLRLTESGRPLSEADILYILEASDHEPLQNIIKHFEDDEAFNNS